jgi:hypothetical protein
MYSDVPPARSEEVAACLSAIDRASRWIVQNIHLFIPFENDNVEDDDIEDDDVRRARLHKSVAELAIVLYCQIKLLGDRDSDNIRRIAAKLESVQRNPQFRSRMLRRPEEFSTFATLYGVLRELGCDDTEQHELIQRLVNVGALDHAERPPNRMMEIRLLLERGGFRHAWPGLDRLCDASILTQAVCPLHLDHQAAYALTHVVMFLYDFGVAPDGMYPVKEFGDLRRTLTMLIVIYCQEKHWDLLGEVLICWDCVKFGDSLLHRKAWEVFLATQKNDGSFPGPEIARANRPKRQELYDYHTTFVAIIAGSLRTCRVRTARVPISTMGLQAADKLKVLSDSDRLQLDRCHAAMGARSWLERCLDFAEADTQSPLATFLYILVGSWLCASMHPDGNLSVDDVIDRVATALTAREIRSAVCDSQAPATLKLIAAALLSARGRVVPSLEKFLYGSAEVLSALSVSDRETELLLYEKRMLFSKLGLHSAPASIDYSEVLRFAHTLPLNAPVSEIERLVLRIEALTGCGLRDVTVEADNAWIEELLCGFAMHFLRQYDFLLGCRLLRSSCYLKRDNPAIVECVQFLLLHQQPAGPFGFFGAEEAALEASRPESYSPEASLYLPITISCLSALAESSSLKWRLLGSLPRIR